MSEIILKLDYVNLIIVSVIVSVFASALHVYFPKFFSRTWAKKTSVLFIATFVTYLNITIFLFSQEITLAEYILKFLFTWSFALLFYSLMGVWTVNRFFELIKSKLEK